jgi:hypothetical protein
MSARMNHTALTTAPAFLPSIGMGIELQVSAVWTDDSVHYLSLFGALIILCLAGI